MRQETKHTLEGLQAEDYMFGEDALIERLQAEKMELLGVLELLYGCIEDTGIYNDWHNDPKAVRVRGLIAKAKGES